MESGFLEKTRPLMEQEEPRRVWESETLGPGGGPGKSIKRAGFPEAAAPMPGQASHTSCGKRHPRVCSMLCFSRADGLLRSIYNFF